MANSTIVYTTARTRFTVPRRAFSMDTINVYYSTNTTSPAPADVLTGAVLVDPGAYTVEGIGARADAFVIDWPAAPTSGTLIVDVESAIGRISNFPDNQLPSGAALNREFDHIITLTGDNATDITALDVRVTANEGDITALDGRLTTAEGDITTAEADIDALEAWRAGTVDPTLTSHGNRLTAVEGRATALEADALLEVAGVFDAESKRIGSVADPVNAQDAATRAWVTALAMDGVSDVDLPELADVGLPLMATAVDTFDWQQVDTAGIADDAVTTAKIENLAVTNDKLALLAVGTDELIDDAVTAAKLADDATTDGNRAVTTNHIRDLAVTTAKIADDAVTEAKLATGMFARDKLSGVGGAQTSLWSGGPALVGNLELLNLPVGEYLVVGQIMTAVSPNGVNHAGVNARVEGNPDGLGWSVVGDPTSIEYERTGIGGGSVYVFRDQLVVEASVSITAAHASNGVRIVAGVFLSGASTAEFSAGPLGSGLGAGSIFAIRVPNP